MEPGVIWEVPISMDTRRTSVPQDYDVQKESDQVLQGGTEATSKVSQSKNMAMTTKANLKKDGGEKPERPPRTRKFQPAIKTNLSSPQSWNIEPH